jgi:hypothetical protein
VTPRCVCCAGAATVPVVPLLAFFGAVWVIEHLAEVLITCGTCGVLGIVAMVVLTRRADRREATRMAAWRLRHATGAPAITPGQGPAPRRAVVPGLAPAFGFGDLHIHLDGMHTATEAAAVRQMVECGKCDRELVYCPYCGHKLSIEPVVLPAAGPAAIGAPVINIFGVPAAEQAAVIRKALGRD